MRSEKQIVHERHETHEKGWMVVFVPFVFFVDK